MKLSDLNLLAIGNTIQIVGAVFAGEGQMLLCLFPEDQGELRSGDSFRDHPEFVGPDGDDFQVETLDMGTDDWQKFLRQTDILEAEVLQKASDGTLAKAILRKSARQIDTRVSWEVFHRDGFKCRYCGQGPGIPLTVDHLVLWEEGGPSIAANLVSACKKCNKTRGNTQYPDWLKHPHYQKVSKNLSAVVRQDNIDLVETLVTIPRMVHQKSR